MSWAPAIIGLATAGMGAYQTVKAGQEAERQGLLEQQARDDAAKLYDWNARLAEWEAGDALERGAIEETRFRQQVDQFIGTQRAGFAGAGVDVSFGSAVDVVADTAYLGELDALMIRNNARREAWGFKVEAVDQRARALIARKSGIQAAEAGRVARGAANWAAGGILLGAGGSLLANRYGFGGRKSTGSGSALYSI